MNCTCTHVCLLSWIGVLLACARPWGQEQQRLEARIPACESFVLVRHGDRAIGKTELPEARASSLTVDAKAYTADQATGTLSLDLHGRASSGPWKTERQLLTFETADGREPVHVTGILPFDLGQWIGAGQEGRLRYEARSDVLGHDRSLLLDLRQSGRMWILQRHGSSPISIDLDERPVELGVKGLRVIQGQGAAARPYSGHSYAVPLAVQTVDGRATSLWQRDGVTLVAEEEGYAIGIFVLASQVNRPEGKAVPVAEGDPFGLELLIFRVDR